MSKEMQEIHVCDNLNELVDSLRKVRSKWSEYEDILDSGVTLTETAYRAPNVLSGGRG